MRTAAFLAFIATGDAFASSASDLIAAAEARALSRDPVWLKLLHYDRGGRNSEVMTPDFFLAPTGNYDPAAEIRATLQEYFRPWGDDPDNHPRCRFPARYFWLSRHLSLPDYALREPRCRRLERWALRDRVTSISLLQVSGYLGNPASMFGHALLKLNTDAPDDDSGLFDLAVNFGALVPPNEATIVYVARGLFGGYEAGFSDRYFYTQDLVYSRTEFRDIWNYRLRLSQDGRTLLVLHLWEILGKKFVYYFLTKNCAYRLGELLELATDETFVDASRLWYVPAQLFHRVVDIDQNRVALGSAPLVDSIRFVPSSQRALYFQFEQLNATEVSAANDLVNTAMLDASVLRHFDPDRRGEILDAVLSYYQYRDVAEQPTPSGELLAAKDRALSERLRLPARAAPAAKPPDVPAPVRGPMLISAGVARNQRNDEYALLRWAPFSHESFSEGRADSGELTVLDLALGSGNGKGLFVDQAQLLRLRKLNTLTSGIGDESRLSWELSAAVSRVANAEASRTDAALAFGVGRAWEWSPHLVLYAMTDVSAHSVSPHSRARPYVGVAGVTGRWRLNAEAGVENNEERTQWREVWSGAIQYQRSTDRAFRVDFSNELYRRASTSLLFYW